MHFTNPFVEDAVKQEDERTLKGVTDGKQVVEDEGGLPHSKYPKQPCDTKDWK